MMLEVSADHSKPLVLVVDDEETICSTLAGVLEDELYATSVAYDGRDAVEQVRSAKPALVFLDIWMPGWDGIETLERIKEISPLTEVIMISGHATISNALEATKRGAFDFIEKPLDLESVIFSAKRALEKRDTMLRVELAQGDAEQTPWADARSSVPLLTHPGVLSPGLRGRDLRQRTLKRSAILYGQCLHSGMKSGLVLEPLPANSGIHFVRIGQPKAVPAFIDYVESTGFATTIRTGSSDAATIEHLMAVLHMYRISNLLVKCNGEVPIFDGSAVEFCKTIEEVGIEEQRGSWHEILIDQPVEVANGDTGESIAIFPQDSFSVHYELNYPTPVGKQLFDIGLESVETFKNEIAPARTFGFMKDVERLQRAGLAAGGRLNNFILIGPDRVVNTELRFPDELVRHKILDVIGDLFLLGRPLCGRVVARMTGHSDNISLVTKLREQVIGKWPDAEK